MARRRSAQKSEATEAANSAAAQEGIINKPQSSAPQTPQGKPQSPTKVALLLWLLPLVLFIAITVIKFSMEG